MATDTSFKASTLVYARANSSTWNSGGACQGAYQNTSASASRVGVIMIPSLPAALTGKVITNIVMTFTCTGAGSASSSKVLTLHKSLKQSTSTSGNGNTWVGDTLGTLTGKFYSNTVSHTLNASTNAGLFNNMAAYLSEGNYVLVCYNGEKSSSSSTYSSNYLRISELTLTVTYEEAGGGVLVKSTGGGSPASWSQGKAYVYTESGWVLGEVYAYDGSTWVRSSY